jgi:hypothetical protein
MVEGEGNDLFAYGLYPSLKTHYNISPRILHEPPDYPSMNLFDRVDATTALGLMITNELTICTQPFRYSLHPSFIRARPANPKPDTTLPPQPFQNPLHLSRNLFQAIRRQKTPPVQKHCFRLPYRPYDTMFTGRIDSRGVSKEREIERKKEREIERKEERQRGRVKEPVRNLLKLPYPYTHYSYITHPSAR